MVARILLGLAIALTLVSSILNWKTKEKATGLQDQLKVKLTEATTIAAEKAKAVTEAKAAQEQLTAANTAKDAALAEVTAAKGEADKVKADLQAAKAAADAKETEINSLKEKIASAIPAATPAGGVDPAELEVKLKEAQTKLEEQIQLTQTLQAKSTEAENHAKTLEEDKKRRDAGLSAPGLEGKVLAVNPNWNFVVLSIGDRQGVAMNSTLIVKRGTSLVAKLRITSVEPATSIADIVPGSTTKGNFVRPGDTVIYSGS